MKGAYRWRLKHNFNPRAPCGARPASTAGTIGEVTFQSTRPVRGATKAFEGQHPTYEFQSTRPVRGATPCLAICRRKAHYFNPRAPCGARPCYRDYRPRMTRNFNPRAPCGARPACGGFHQAGQGISIHAPRAGRDRTPARATSTPKYFNPRAPCGARQQKYTKLLYTLLRQKAILRQFHAKRRLLKRFSTYKYRNTFLICSANRMGKICTLPLRTTRSLDLPEGMSACSQSARFCFRTFFPSSKTADYPALDP